MYISSKINYNAKTPGEQDLKIGCEYEPMIDRMNFHRVYCKVNKGNIKEMYEISNFYTFPKNVLNISTSKQCTGSKRYYCPAKLVSKNNSLFWEIRDFNKQEGSIKKVLNYSELSETEKEIIPILSEISGKTIPIDSTKFSIVPKL